MRLGALGLGLSLLLVGCGHDRPTDAERVLVPLVPEVLPPGYVLSRIDERPLPGGGRWIDFSFVPHGNGRLDPRGVVSLHQRLDIEPSSAFLGPGEPIRLRGTTGLCTEGGTLRWTETPSAQLSVGGGGLTCRQLQGVAESLVEVGPATWRTYEASGRDEDLSGRATPRRRE